LAEPRLTTDHVPPEWVANATCVCAKPQPTIRAERKGAARTVCARCEQPIKVGFGR